MSSSCNLIQGNSYCVERNWGIPPEEPEPSTTSSAAPPSTTTDPGTGVETPSPIQEGMTEDCNHFYFVKAGDSCAVIASSHHISLSDFYDWNPAVKPDCTGLWANVYVCVGTFGGSTPSPTPTSTGPPGNGVETPTPIQEGMTDECEDFYLVQPGDGCAAIASTHGISLSDFYEWNPAVGSDCVGLWANVYVCVGIIGGSPPPTSTVSSTTTTTPGNGITTPTPTQPGMVDDCDTFHFVESGQGCALIAGQYGISLSDFYTWNPTVGENCGGLWANVYVCVSVIGGSPPEPTPTQPGNGITTPTPVLPGMVDDCDVFHKVEAGDGCWDLATAAGISLDDFYAWNPQAAPNCAGLWVGYYVCLSRL